ncbi:hypothetical protein A9Q94_14140 [Rhodobacterales bacterium 56_14_T64]|nr:hypothetical protein A9Q94_14140 [Rhodobacterales bacterium 56_14_T64]
MTISATTSLANNTPPAAANQPIALKDQLGQLDFSQVLKELDLDGDGQISDQEFDFYRAGKAARGEFVPADGPDGQATGRKAASDMTETLFHKAMEKRISAS